MREGHRIRGKRGILVIVQWNVTFLCLRAGLAGKAGEGKDGALQSRVRILLKGGADSTLTQVPSRGVLLTCFSFESVSWTTFAPTRQLCPDVFINLSLFDHKSPQSTSQLEGGQVSGRCHSWKGTGEWEGLPIISFSKQAPRRKSVW